METQGGGSRLQKLLKIIESKFITLPNRHNHPHTDHSHNSIQSPPPHTGGSSLNARQAAAAQVASILSSHPAQLPAIIADVSQLLYLRDWDARVAGAHCLGLIAQHFCHHTPASLLNTVTTTTSTIKPNPPPDDKPTIPSNQNQDNQEEYEGMLKFSTFDISQVLKQGRPLLASGGEEYDDDGSLSSQGASLTQAEALARQKANLKARLGLGGGGPMDSLVDTTDMFGDEDLIVSKTGKKSSVTGSGGKDQDKQGDATATNVDTTIKEEQQKSATEVLADMPGLSARERAAALRRAKALKRQGRSAANGSMRPPPSKRLKPTPSQGQDAASTATAGLHNIPCEEEWEKILAGSWPFQHLCDALCVDLLHPVWEVRHGAALGLREVLKNQAGCAHVTVGSAGIGGWAVPGGNGLLPLVRNNNSTGGVDAHGYYYEHAIEANRAWLEDACIHMLCTLGLDRFGDFVSDKMVAPVRETTAQALGVAARALPTAALPALLSALKQLAQGAHGEWSVKLGGLLGIKYVLATRTVGENDKKSEEMGVLMDAALPAAVSGLQDKDDDVQAVAAEALLPVASQLAADTSTPAALQVKELLWGLLTELSDLSPATASVMSLLAAMYTSSVLMVDNGTGGTITDNKNKDKSSSSSSMVVGEELAAKVPRLWKYMRHPLISVRRGVVDCLTALLQCYPPTMLFTTEQPALQLAAQLLFQNILMESEQDIAEKSLHAWSLFVDKLLLQQQQQQPNCCFDRVLVERLLKLAATPTNRKLDPALVVVATSTGKDGGTTASSCTLAMLEAQKKPNNNNNNNTKGYKDGGEDGGGSRVGKEGIQAGGDNDDTARVRIAAALAVGYLAKALSLSTSSDSKGSKSMVGQVLGDNVKSSSATMRLMVGLAASAWAQLIEDEGEGLRGSDVDVDGGGGDALAAVVAQCNHELSSPNDLVGGGYIELIPLVNQLKRQVEGIVQRVESAGMKLSLTLPQQQQHVAVTVATLPQLLSISNDGGGGLLLRPENVLALLQQIPATATDIQTAKHAVSTTATLLQTNEALLNTMVGAALASSIVHCRSSTLPAKLNSLIQPLVAAVRREPQERLQAAAAKALARLTMRCADRTPGPSDKIVKNMIGFACGDPRETPRAGSPPGVLGGGDEEAQDGRGEQKKVGGGGKKNKGSAAAEVAQEAFIMNERQQQDPAAQVLGLARRGGEEMLRCLAHMSGSGLIQTLPTLWDALSTPLSALLQQQQGRAFSEEQLQAMINALHVIHAIAPALHAEVVSSSIPNAILPGATAALSHPNNALKLAAAKCIASLGSSGHTETVVPPIFRSIIPLLAGGATDDARTGGLLALQHLVQSLQTDLVPYCLLIVVPLMGRMSDPLGLVRDMASRAFATVVALLPLAQGADVPAGLDKEQLETLERERVFLSQLLDGGKAEDYAAPVSLKNEAVLRRYQQEGVNWLAFLKRFGLHGVLADDMGLGKTLQSTMIMAASTAEARQTFATALPPTAPRPHLIVCPATLVSHWPHEIDKFVDSSVLSALRYGGSPAQRAQQRSSIKDHDVVVMSYESLRSDADWIASQQWLYCILDEGHAIRNPNSTVSKAAKRIRAQHRLVLSGTPIQNSVLELWAIFDFLMPGFLGSHRSFNAKYGKALAEARGTVSISGTTTTTSYNRKTKASTQKAVESGLLSLEGLHRQVMPFVLRRTKDQVLSDLPPKIIQDVLCELSPLQKILYEQFSASQALKEVQGVVSADASSSGTTPGGGAAAGAPHVFQALQYLRKLCSHPALVLDPSLPQHQDAVTKVLHLRHSSSSSSSCGGGKDTTWDQSIQRIKQDVSHAPKLMALKELLIDCGVANFTGDDDLGSGGSGRHAQKEEEEDIQGGIQEDAGHRVLVFAQLRSLLDIVEDAVLKPLGISSLRLDGGVPVASRFERVQQFNADPTIGVMLLTTAVGGLGLNLTAADTVVFLEHDWNPMADLQAMDRAHRLGQRRTVNVYRLLVGGTLEERVMSLQRFKLDVAATVVNADNVSLASMDTDNLLDLFTVEEEGGGGGGGGRKKKVEVCGEGGEEEGGGGSRKKNGGLAALMESLGDAAAAEGQYAEEFDLASFTAKLK